MITPSKAEQYKVAVLMLFASSQVSHTTQGKPMQQLNNEKVGG